MTKDNNNNNNIIYINESNNNKENNNKNQFDHQRTRSQVGPDYRRWSLSPMGQVPLIAAAFPR